jgi:hypothetical protein
MLIGQQLVGAASQAGKALVRGRDTVLGTHKIMPMPWTVNGGARAAAEP